MRVSDSAVVWFLFAGILLSGCVEAPQGSNGDEGEDEGETPRVAPEVMPWGLEECRYIVAFGWVDGDRFTDYLPEGFSPRRDPLAPGADADTWFGFDIMSCTSGVGLNGTVSPMEFGYIWAAADPPEAYLQEDVSASEHYVKWDILVPDAPRRTALEARGVPVRDGEASLTVIDPVITGSLSLDGVGDLSVMATPSVERIAPFEGDFVKISSAQEGVAAWRASALSGTRMSGTALLSFEEGSWPTQVVGGNQLAGQFHSGVWGYSDAEIRFMEDLAGG